MSRAKRIGAAVGPPLVAGVVMSLSLPPFGFWILAFPAAALLWWELGRLRAARRLLAGWLFGLGLYGVGLWWVTDFNVYGGLVLIVVEALAPALACALTPRRRGRTPALAGWMVLLELGRSSWPFGGLPLGGVALGQAASPLAPAARLGGAPLLVGLVWLGGAGLGALACAAGRWWRGHRSRPAGQRHGWDRPAGLVTAGVLAIAAVAGVAVWGGQAPDGGQATTRILVAAVQGGGRRGLSKSEVPPSSVFDAQVAATRALEARSVPSPRLIVWPEDVVALDRPLAGSPEESVVSSLARAAHATLLAGVTEPAGPGHFRNLVVAFGPDGRVVDSFEKVHRVPFGEYVPLRGLVRHLADLSQVPQDAVAGSGDGVLHTPAGPLGTMVSYEVFFPERGRAATSGGATLLVVPTNTSSYSTAQVPTQEVAAARLQALSEGRDLVQAAPTGFSALVDHDGRVLQRSSLGTRALVVGTLSMRDGRTVYHHYGDLPVVILAVAGVLGGWAAALLAPLQGADHSRRSRARRLR